VRRSFVSGVLAAAAVGLLALGCAKSPGEEAGGKGAFREGGGAGGIATRPAPGVNAVYFDYDRSEIRADGRQTLKANSEVIQKNDWDELVLEGHCDERGTEEYNLALGERRSNSVKRYLSGLGVGKTTLTTVSYGESRPAKPGHDESAWKWNRRVEFGLPIR
jgi:peptidoglycan-associated lipoprotein